VAEAERERRKFLRVPVCLSGGFLAHPAKLAESAIVTRNLSQSGLYCDCESQLEMFTIVKVRLLIHLPESKRKKAQEILCEGIVVRCAKEGKEPDYPYSIAIHFLDISDEDRKILAQLIAHTKAEQSTKKEPSTS
jgi:hypothetical protein